MLAKIHLSILHRCLCALIFSQVGLWIAATECLVAAETILVDGGRARVVIACGEPTTDKECDAAKRLKDFLARMTGVSLDILTIPEVPADMVRILVGPAAARAVGMDIVQTYPGAERVVLKRIGKDIVIAGNDAQVYQGTRHAVDRFLSELGCECFGPDPNWHVVPKTDQVVVGDIDVDTSPDFDFRSDFFFQHPWEGSHPDYDPPSWGLGGKLVHMPHNYENIVPYSLIEEHPEYFARVNGKRTARGAQICFSNPEVVARAVQAAQNHFENNPAQLMFSLSANDCAGFCECPACKKLGENPGGQTLSFCNAVVHDLRKTHPEKSVATIAYFATLEAPKRIKSGPGVIVFVVNQSCRAHAHDSSSCPTKKPWLEKLAAWKATGAEVTGIYEYYMTAWGNYKHLPAFFGDAALRDLRFYKSQGIKSVFCEGAAFATIEDSPLQWPLHYVMAKGLWSRDLTAEQILRPACQKLFGQAAEPMLSFYMTCAKALEANPKHSSMWGLPDPSLTYTPEVLATLRGQLGLAMSKAAGESPEVVGRILDVFECWSRAENRLIEHARKRQYPKYLSDAFNGQPGVQLIASNAVSIPGVSDQPAPKGDCAFTLFFVAKVENNDGSMVLVGWGNPHGVAQMSAIEIEAGRLDWATGWSEDALTPDGSFDGHFDRPVLICIRKTPGSINQTTSIWLNGNELPVTEKSSSRTPDIKNTPLRIGGEFFTSEMTVGEVLLYNRALTDNQIGMIGSYLTDKFNLQTGYSSTDRSDSPERIKGLCAWFQPTIPHERQSSLLDRDE